jgi:replicative DNA helicase
VDDLAYSAQVLKLILGKKFYNKNKALLLPDLFPGQLGVVYSEAINAHEDAEGDVSLSDLRALLKANHPTLSRAARTALYELCTDIENADTLDKSVGEKALRGLWREFVGHKIAEIGLDITEDRGNLGTLKALIEQAEEGFIPETSTIPVSTDVEAVLLSLSRRATWAFNIDSLRAKLPGISEGELLIVTARPETGKTAFWVSLVAGPDGFCAQGASVHAICNEEPAVRTMMRCISSYTGMTQVQVREDVATAKEKFAEISNNLTLLDTSDMSVSGLDAYVKKHQPKILVIDQIDKLNISGSFARSDERLGKIYEEVRNIAKRHGCVIMGLTQASADGDAKTVLRLSMMAGSKTAKAAEADVVIGIGATDNMEDPIRYLALAKNKVTGDHSTVVCKIQSQISRYIS